MRKILLYIIILFVLLFNGCLSFFDYPKNIIKYCYNDYTYYESKYGRVYFVNYSNDTNKIVYSYYNELLDNIGYLFENNIINIELFNDPYERHYPLINENFSNVKKETSKKNETYCESIENYNGKYLEIGMYFIRPTNNKKILNLEVQGKLNKDEQVNTNTVWLVKIKSNTEYTNTFNKKFYDNIYKVTVNFLYIEL
jgi:hypothetical protein